MINPENIYKSNIIYTEQAEFRDIYIYVYNNNEKRGHEVEHTSKERNMKEFEGRNGKKEMMPLYYNLKKCKTPYIIIIIFNMQY